VKRVNSLYGFILIVALWEGVRRAFDIPSYLLPGPLEVADALEEMAQSGQLFRSAVASLFRVSWGFYLAVLTAVPLGLAMGRLRKIREVMNPVIQFLRPISPLAWIPMALMWFGIGDRPAIFLIYLSAFFPMVVFTVSGVAGIKTTFLRVAENFGLRGRQLYMKVILPAAMPEIIVGLRITLGTAWLVIVAAEMIAVKSGLGYLIIDARNSLRMDKVVAGMLVIGVIGLVLDHLIRLLEDLPWVEWSRKRR
jgi:NitT/TauT family transport system permease protein